MDNAIYGNDPGDETRYDDEEEVEGDDEQDDEDASSNEDSSISAFASPPLIADNTLIHAAAF